jgi:hypothetical protein
VAWLERGASARQVLELGVPATVLPSIVGRKGIPVTTVMIGVDPHKASHTAVAVNATEEKLGELRVRAAAPGGAAADMGRGLAGADLGG